MHPRSLATLKELDVADWFSNVGQPCSAAAMVLPSWDAAIEACSAVEWENVGLEMANRLTVRLAKDFPTQFARWNDIVKEVKPAVVSLVDRKVAGVVIANTLPKVFSDSVRWDILHLIMEAEYSDLVSPSFYSGQGYWYLEGRFPCGWQSEPTPGAPIIY